MQITNLTQWKAWAASFPQHASPDTAYISPFQLVNKGSENQPAEILIYEQIGKDFWSGEGLAAKEFSALLKIIGNTRDVTIAINSPGGSVFDGLSIYNQLVSHGGKVTTRNDGIAASIASVILQAGAERKTNEGAMIMIHRAWGMMIGNAADAESFKQDLQKHDATIAAIYASRSGMPESGFSSAMEKETIYTGREAFTAGLVDTVIPMKKHEATNNLDNRANEDQKTLVEKTAKPDIQMNAAGINKKEKIVMTENTPAPAANPPAPEMTEILQAIKDLGKAIKPIDLPGVAPVTNTPISNLGNPMIERFNNLEHGVERSTWIKNNYQQLSKKLVDGGIYNANTIDAALANSVLSSDAVTTLRTYLAPIAAFTRKTEMVAVTPRQVINVPLVSSSASMQTNPTSFETGDSTEALIAVTVNQYSKSFHVSIADKNLGASLANLGPTNAAVLAEGVWGLVTAKMIVGSFGATTVIGAASSFDPTDLPAILALGKNYPKVSLLLDGGHLAYLLPTDRLKFVFGEPGAYGFDGGIWKNNLWTGATANCVGLVFGPDALVIATALPAVLPTGEFIQSETASVGNGLSVTSSTWFSRASRSLWSSYDVMFGCAVGDGSQAEVLVSA